MQLNDILFGIIVSICIIAFVKLVVDEIIVRIRSRRIDKELQKYSVTISDAEMKRIKQRREMDAVKRRVAQDLIERGIVGRG